MNVTGRECDMKPMEKQNIADLTIRELLTRRPEMTRVFLGLRMSCVGCPISKFETVRDAARNYGRDPEMLLKLLENCSRSRGRLGWRKETEVQRRY
jgi:hybrid cluster-associated redox disulfide protein